MDETETPTEAFGRHCLAVRARLQQAALETAGRAGLARWASALGLPVDAEGAQIAEAELAFARDLAVYGGGSARGRPIDRTARLVRSPGDATDQVQRALAAAWFSVFRVGDAHPEGGVLVDDVLLGGEAWVLDPGLTEAGGSGAILACRLGRVQGFAITTGAVAALDEGLLQMLRQVVRDAGLPPAELVADSRFALLAYRYALGLQDS